MRIAAPTAIAAAAIQASRRIRGVLTIASEAQARPMAMPAMGRSAGAGPASNASAVATAAAGASGSAVTAR